MTATRRSPAALAGASLAELTIEDEASFRDIALYGALKRSLARGRYRFRILGVPASGRWDRALFLNLTFWSGRGGDVLAFDRLAADVVAHVAWHHVATKALARSARAPLSADALFLGESIASAFDLYLVGRLLADAPRATFLETQVPAMADAASAAGMPARAFEALLRSVARDPASAFEDLRALLFDATTALVRCEGVPDATRVLAKFDRHRFGSLLHHYELSNWVLHARAYAPRALGRDRAVRSVDRSLRRADVALDWLAEHWL